MTIKFDDKGLVPAIIQDASTKDVLMLGYMNQEAWETTQEKGLVTFFSRSKQRLWTKGETSNNFLEFVSAEIDCDNDTLLIQANPKGPTCHTGTDTCFGNKPAKGFLYDLERVIAQRQESADEESYTVKLLNKGPKKIAQKVPRSWNQVEKAKHIGANTHFPNDNDRRCCCKTVNNCSCRSNDD